MKNLLLSSFLFFIVSCSCSIAHHHRFHIAEGEAVTKKIHPIIQNDTSALLYKAGIKIYGKYFSGLFLFKKMNDTTQRVVFSSETGITFFDFEFSGSRFTILQCFEKFRNVALIRTFRKDLSMILMTGIQHAHAEIVKYKKEEQLILRFKEEKEYFYYYSGDHPGFYTRIENTSKCFKRVIILLDKSDSGITSHISIRHKNINLKIDLQLIPRI